MNTIENSDTRRNWCETGAYDHFYDLERSLPKHLRDRARVGAVFTSEMLGTEGKNLWLFPVEGHKKILAPKSKVSLFTKTGEIFYDGLWENCSEALLLRHEEFYIWLKPIENREESQPSLGQRVKGLGRLVRHKIIGRRH